EPLAEQEPRHDGGHRWNEKEKAGHVRRGTMPQQPVEQADGADRQHHDQPTEREDEARNPLDLRRLLEYVRERRVCDRAPEELDECAAAQVDMRAVALLIQRANADAEKGD